MQILRGGGPKRPPRPFNFNPWIARQNQKRRALVNRGLAPAGDKASLRAAATEAAASHPIQRIATGASRFKPND